MVDSGRRLYLYCFFAKRKSRRFTRRQDHFSLAFDFCVQDWFYHLQLIYGLYCSYERDGCYNEKDEQNNYNKRVFADKFFHVFIA